jgi:hypothetical protein
MNQEVLMDQEGEEEVEDIFNISNSDSDSDSD